MDEFIQLLTARVGGRDCLHFGHLPCTWFTSYGFILITLCDSYNHSIICYLFSFSNVKHHSLNTPRYYFYHGQIVNNLFSVDNK